MSYQHLSYSAICSLAMLAAGCSGSEGKTDVYEVTGKVTMSGGPVSGATVIFSPKEGQPVATGRTNTAGEFSLSTYDPDDGAAAGEYVVLVSKEAPPEDSGKPQSHEAFVSGEFKPGAAHAGRGPGRRVELRALLPEKYGRIDQSGLTAKVTPDGENNFPLDLKP